MFCNEIVRFIVGADLTAPTWIYDALLYAFRDWLVELYSNRRNRTAESFMEADQIARHAVSCIKTCHFFQDAMSVG